MQAPAAHADVAFLLCGTVSHLLTNSDVAACFASVSERLRPGGLFVLEMLHPEDLFGGSVEVRSTASQAIETECTRDEADFASCMLHSTTPVRPRHRGDAVSLNSSSGTA